LLWNCSFKKGREKREKREGTDKGGSSIGSVTHSTAGERRGWRHRGGNMIQSVEENLNPPLTGWEKKRGKKKKREGRGGGIPSSFWLKLAPLVKLEEFRAQRKT